MNFIVRHKKWWPTPDSDGRPLLSKVDFHGYECDLVSDQGWNDKWWASIHHPVYGELKTESVFPDKNTAADAACNRFLAIMFYVEHQNKKNTVFCDDHTC